MTEPGAENAAERVPSAHVIARADSRAKAGARRFFARPSLPEQKSGSDMLRFAGVLYLYGTGTLRPKR